MNRRILKKLTPVSNGNGRTSDALGQVSSELSSDIQNGSDEEYSLRSSLCLEDTIHITTKQSFCRTAMQRISGRSCPVDILQHFNTFFLEAARQMPGSV